MIATLLILILLAILWPVTMLRVFSFAFQALLVLTILAVGFLIAFHFGYTS